MNDNEWYHQLTLDLSKNGVIMKPNMIIVNEYSRTNRNMRTKLVFWNTLSVNRSTQQTIVKKNTNIP